MVDWSTGIFVFLVMTAVPLLMAWSERLASKNGGNGTTFRPAPPLRAAYPGMLIASILAEFFYAKDLWEAKRSPALMDWFALAGMLAIFLVCVYSWPPTLRATPAGLWWQRLLSRRFIPWDQVESAYSGMDKDLVISTKGSQRYEVSQYIQGRAELKALIKRKLTELHGPNAHVR
jgi:hypothetical protein